MKNKVSIVLLNYNTTQDTIECIESLLQIEYKNYDIIVVDNNSNEDEIYRLEKYIRNIDKCKLIKSGYNGGFAFGNNIGIRYAQQNNAEYILLLNCDTEVEKGFLTRLVNAINEDDEKNIIATGKINYFSDKGKIWYGGGQIDWRNYTGVHFSEGEDDNGQCDKKKEITFATGCLMLINNKIKTDITLSEDYFMYYEDVDFCARLINEGYKIIYEPKSIIYHKIGASGGGEGSAFTLRWSNRGRLIFLHRFSNNTKSKLKFMYIKTKFYITRIIKICILLCVNKKSKAEAIYLGIKDGKKFIENSR